jgi:hypothetical protein
MLLYISLFKVARPVNYNNEFQKISNLLRSTVWGKITSLLSVGNCEGGGGCRRVGLGSKGAGSREVPVTTLPSRKDIITDLR